MRTWFFRSALTSVTWLFLTGVSTEARAGLGADWAGADAAALHELLGGPSGMREMWEAPPELVILTSVMDYSREDVRSGYVATGESLTVDDITRLTEDLTAALNELTAGRLAAFAAVRLEAVPTGQTAKVFRRGQIVAGRFRGVRATTGTIGYGGRTARNGAITAAAVILDHDFDRESGSRRLLRTHELGHALGYNHVESRPSVMNPHVGGEISTFDRGAIERAFSAQPAISEPLGVQSSARQN